MTAPSPAEQQDRRRRPLLPWLGAVVVLQLLLGLALLARGEADDQAGTPQSPTSPLPRVVVDAPGAVVSGDLEAGADGAGASAQDLGLAVRGRVVGALAPGRTTSLVVTVDNPLDSTVLVTAVAGRVTAVSPAACRRDWYRVGSFTGARRVAAGGSADLVLPITLTDLATHNQDACKGARYRFTVDVSGRQA